MRLKDVCVQRGRTKQNGQKDQIASPLLFSLLCILQKSFADSLSIKGEKKTFLFKIELLSLSQYTM